MNICNKIPLVSVIIPNYNHAHYLDDRIKSILSQTYTNYEIIILDDCSNDDSIQIIKRYQNNPHVSKVVINEINSGSTFIQWKRGIEHARGELIWLAESDDLCSPDFLELLVSEFKNNNKLVLAFTTSRIIDQDNCFHNVIQPKRHRKNIRSSGKHFIRKYLYRYNIIYNASSALFKKSAVDGISDEYLTYRASGDWLFWILISEKGDVSMINNPCNFFRKHLANITNRYAENGLQQYENKKILEYLTKRRLIPWMLRKKVELLSFYHIKYDLVFVNQEVRNNVLKVWNISGFMKILLYPLHLIYLIRNRMILFVL